SLQEAEAAVERIEAFLDRAADVVADAQLQREDAAPATGEGAAVYVAAFSSVPAAFRQAMEDDLNVPQALAVLHDSVRAGNSALAAGDVAAVEGHYADVEAMVGVLGLDDVPEPDSGADPAARQALDTLIRAQLDARAAARAAKDWATADAIRDTLAAAGVVVEDSAEGVRWSLQ
ncbi:MAG TPA: DALR domain-containing protein, partial [Citricoccus sp.]